MMIEIYGKTVLGIISLLVGLLDGLIIFLISDRKISESAVVLGKKLVIGNYILFKDFVQNIGKKNK